MEFQSEDKLRNKLNKDGDSLMEQKKMENGQDIEPEAEEWVAKTTPGMVKDDRNSSK
ncbi:hypothetical protein OIN60_01150 [Paenibacillus sp. P96]|uniref:YfhD family protein n=1 Tax=Paenibacillus zeirhizosphaerae TaxID=2987519 RepID=A0ABT9FKZ0_9BACL|nr:hypothetical protein [Paenibacillus sp. P96]MDP4095399.1 hypothetical protein [Paenibacillus sp. P96]